MQVVVRSLSEARRCAYCHDDPLPGQMWECKRCAAALHVGCSRQLARRCTTLWCPGDSGDRPLWQRILLGLIDVAVLISLAFLSFVALMIVFSVVLALVCLVAAVA